MSDWKYDLDEVGEEAESEEEDERDQHLEPGSPSLENAFFVALGAATTLLVFARAILAVGG
ncbi:hypothetical protein BRD15_11070 [Halobacteriales archaeon SW_6_65_15]|jgi:hypothetical protein|nr:MAG: hypothetical protein BRD15_11070 [Halobacteriales archaeon SW_6_65_15]